MALVASPALIVTVFAVCWLIAPALMKVLPAWAFAEPSDPSHEPSPAPRTPPAPTSPSPSEPGVINLDPDALATDNQPARSTARRERR